MRSQKTLPLRILIKAILFVVLFSLAFSLLMNVPIGRLSLYNHLYPGRERFPFGESPATSYNLSIYNLMGQKVTTLIDGHNEAGQHSVSWDAANYSSGIYFYRLSAGERVFTERMTLLK